MEEAEELLESDDAGTGPADRAIASALVRMAAHQWDDAADAWKDATTATEGFPPAWSDITVRLGAAVSSWWASSGALTSAPVVGLWAQWASGRSAPVRHWTAYTAMAALAIAQGEIAMARTALATAESVVPHLANTVWAATWHGLREELDATTSTEEHP
jgi:hypothetical protein